MAIQREQSPREVLFAYASRAQAARAGSCELGSTVFGHLASGEAQGGLTPSHATGTMALFRAVAPTRAVSPRTLRDRPDRRVSRSSRTRHRGARRTGRAARSGPP